MKTAAKNNKASCSNCAEKSDASFVQKQAKPQAMQQPPIQSKLKVGHPNDKYEKEADSMATRVMRMPMEQSAPIAQKSETPGVQLKACCGCGGDAIQMKSMGGNMYASGDIQSTLNSSKGKGSPLASGLNRQMSSSFGTDFSNVRVHTDNSAVQMNEQLNAKAFTNGSDIYFNKGQYNPYNSSGKELLAHELTHVVQQGGGGAGSVEHEVPGIQTYWGESYVDSAVDTLSDSYDYAVDKTSDGLLWAEDKVSGAIEAGKEFLGDVAEKYAPGLMRFLRGDIIGIIQEKVVSAIDSMTGGVLSQIQSQGLGGVLSGLFEGVLGSAGEMASSGCQSIVNVAKQIIAFGKKIGGAAFKKLSKLFSKIGNFFSKLWKDIGSPAVEAIKKYAGKAWEWISAKAKEVWDMTAGIRELASKAWGWVKKQFGIAWGEASGVLEWLKKKATVAWGKVKEIIKPILGPLKVIAGIAVILSPAGPLVAIYYGAPYLWSALKWIVGKWQDANIIGKAKEYIRETIVPAIQRFIGYIRGAINTAINWLSGLLDKLTNALIGALSYLGWLPTVKSIVNSISDGIVELSTWVTTQLRSLGNKAINFAKKVWRFIKPIAEYLRQLILVSVLGPLSILDDGVWSSMKKVIQFGLTVPCIREIGNFAQVPLIITKIDNARTVIKGVWKIYEQKDKVIEEIKKFIRAQLDKVSPAVQEAYHQLPESGRLHSEIVWSQYLQPMLVNLKENWWETVKTAMWEAIWPFDGIGTVTESDPSKMKGLGKELYDVGHNFSQSVEKFKAFDFSACLDHFLMALRNVMAIVNRFAGWVIIGIIGFETIMGAVGGAAAGGVGTIPGAMAGFGAGLATAETIGIYLLGTTLAIEAGILAKAIYSLYPVADAMKNEEKGKENHENYTKISEVTFLGGIMVAMVLLAALAGKLATAFAKKVQRFIPKKWLDLRARIKAGINKGRNKEIVRGRSTTDDAPTTNSKKGSSDVDVELTNKELLDNSANKRVDEMSPQEVQAELQSGLDSGKAKPIDDVKYDLEIKADNGHTWKRDKNTGTWCRFTVSDCGIDANKVVGKKTLEDIDNASSKSGVQNTKADTPSSKRTSELIEEYNLPDPPEGYHYAKVDGEIKIRRNKGRAKDLPKKELAKSKTDPEKWEIIDAKKSGKPKYSRSMKERKKALLRDKDKLDPKAKAYIEKHDGKKVPNKKYNDDYDGPIDYEVHHKEPLYTESSMEGKKALDIEDNLETIPVKDHKELHKICGDAYHEFKRN